MKRYFLPTLIAACLFSVSIHADDMKGMNHEMSHMNMQSSPNAQSAPYDHQFLDTMMQHHKMAMHMAEMAEPKATHAELKEKIRMMKDEQQKEMEELQSLKQKLYGDKGDAINMKMPGMMSMKNMDMHTLYSAQGEEFDSKFVTMMNKHHQGGITMAQNEVSRGKQSEVKAIAKKIIENQKKDIAEMTKMKKQWGSKS
jgi:uncharacterized protein (DUF305 family)